MTRGASMYEALISVACLQSDKAAFGNLTICVQDIGDGPPDVFSDIQDRIEKLGATLKGDAQRGFGDDLWQSLHFFALRDFGETDFVCFDPGTVIFKEGVFDGVSRFASKSFAPGWPVEHLYGSDRTSIWTELAAFADVDVALLSNLAEHPAAWQYWPHLDGRLVCGENATSFGETFSDLAKRVLKVPPPILETQENRRALRQIVLPLAFAKQGGVQNDIGAVEGRFQGCLPSARLVYFYASAPEEAVDHLEASVGANTIKKLLKNYEPAKRLIYQGKGRELRKRFYEPNGQSPKRLTRRLKRHTKWWVR